MKTILPFLIFALVLTGCQPGPEPIQFGKDQCAYCKMSIADPKFGAELVTAKGRVYKFDALECLVPYLEEHPKDYSHVMAIAYDDPKKLHPVENMAFVISEEIRSPMGAWLLSFSAESEAEKYAQNGKQYDWEGIKDYLLNEEW